METKILLNTIDRVKKFAAQIQQSPAEADVSAGTRYIIDAKSIMGLFSLDLSRPLNLRIHGTDQECKETMELIKDFIVK